MTLIEARWDQGVMEFDLNFLIMRAAEERSAAWAANNVEASRIHQLAAECYEAQARALSQRDPHRSVSA